MKTCVAFRARGSTLFYMYYRGIIPTMLSHTLSFYHVKPILYHIYFISAIVQMFVLTLETNVRPDLDDRICLDFLPDAYIKVSVHPGISNNEKSYLTPGSRQRNKQWRHTTERIFFALSGDKEVRRSAARR